MSDTNFEQSCSSCEFLDDASTVRFSPIENKHVIVDTQKCTCKWTKIDEVFDPTQYGLRCKYYTAATD